MDAVMGHGAATPPSVLQLTQFKPTTPMGHIQTREHEEEHCYVYISREELREAYAELKRLARIDRNYDDDRNADRLDGLADKFGEVIDLAHPRRIHFQVCPMNVR